MGTFSCPLRLTSMDGDRSLELDALVDTGAFYTMVPGRLLDQLGVDRADSVGMVLADGRTERRHTGSAWASIDGRRVATRVVFGGDDGLVLLGAYTLEGLDLAVDPVHQRLLPIDVRPG
ncbi:MAG: Retroviral aspartyl protease [Acidimicrobiaceae bacterium]|nr:Retroviral aspartyl protease [Acidimicrobiaceae bacterium]MYE77236.1 Retroviral aspartyl protease [Acidimicrobiaceae bacterium]MYE96188.1 Retroviral aspartyl protease [Acidimicrobiaceae bacterium]MYI52924.1 Retroviral aspartyl protease [Acidimicrobiaceae bacterium]MYJ41894.1 Retroviral aspartyl protease [Acidimicrobiaceae bacterium]